MNVKEPLPPGVTLYADFAPEVKKWADFAKHSKETWVSTVGGDSRPTFIVEKDGEVATMIVSPHPDPYAAFEAAAMVRDTLKPDALLFILDAHMETPRPGETPEQFMERRKKRGKKRLQDMCDDEGACETGEITDCLMCHRLDMKTGKITAINLPYKYHDKSKKTFTWTEENFVAVEEQQSANGGTGMVGGVPDSLRAIYSAPVHPHFQLLREMVTKAGMTEDRFKVVCAKACFARLGEQGFIMLDYHYLTQDYLDGKLQNDTFFSDKLKVVGSKEPPEPEPELPRNKWFGNWDEDSPVRRPGEQMQQPPGPCGYCGEEIEPGYPGVTMLQVSLRGSVERGYHQECFLRQGVGSVGHLEKRCSCHGGDEEDPPGATKRQGAQAVLEWFKRHAAKKGR